MATHSSTLAWEIPWTRSLAGCSPWGCKDIGLDMLSDGHFRTQPCDVVSGRPMRSRLTEEAAEGQRSDVTCPWSLS